MPDNIEIALVKYHLIELNYDRGCCDQRGCRQSGEREGECVHTGKQNHGNGPTEQKILTYDPKEWRDQR